MSADSLPNDIWYTLALDYLSLDAIASISATCKRLQSIASSNSVWIQLSRRYYKIAIIPPITPPDTWKAKYKRLEKFYTLFKNMHKPVNAILLWKDEGVLDTPESIITCLLRNIDKIPLKQLGYLFAKEDRKLFSYFLSQFNFKGHSIDLCLRAMLSLMEFPGEGSYIDRIIEEFSIAYCEQNGLDKTVHDDMYLLSYSLIMLNVDKHSERIISSMTLDQFIRTTAATSLASMPRAELERNYNAISDHQLLNYCPHMTFKGKATMPDSKPAWHKLFWKPPMCDVIVTHKRVQITPIDSEDPEVIIEFDGKPFKVSKKASDHFIISVNEKDIKVAFDDSNQCSDCFVALEWQVMKDALCDILPSCINVQ